MRMNAQLVNFLRRLAPILSVALCIAGCASPRPQRFARAYDLNQPGLRIGAFADCDSEWITRKIFNKAEVVPFDDVERGCLSLLSERIDAFVYDEHILRYISWRYPDRFRLMEPALDTEPSAIAVSAARPALRDELNAFIAGIRANGVYDEMFLRWCHDPERETDGLPDIPEIAAPARADKTLRVGTDCEELPNSFLDAEGNPSGFDVEFIHRFAASRGYAIELVIKPFTELLADVAAGDLDCVVANLDKRPDQKGVLWTDPYIECDIVMMVKIPDEEP